MSNSGLWNPFSYFTGNDTRSTIDNEGANPNGGISVDDAKSMDHKQTNAWSPSNLKSNIQLQYLSAHNDVVRCLCLIDKDRFASCSDDCLILIWSIHNGLLLDVLCGHTEPILCLQMIEHNSHRLLVSASLDHTIRVWDVSDPSTQTQCISISRDHNTSIHKLIFTRDEQLLFTASTNGHIAVWSINPQFDFTITGDNDTQFFILSRIIDMNNKNTKDIANITQILYLNPSPNTKQLIIGCASGNIAFVHLDNDDNIEWIHKHCTQIKYIYQSSVDRFISASYDGLICVWRIETHEPHQMLECINDVELEASAFTSSKGNHLRLNCFIDFVDEFGNKYFIVSFANSFVIFDSNFLVKCMVKNVYDESTDIIAMDTFGDKSDLMLITANNKRHMIKLWSLSKINLSSIKNGIWLSCFHQELLYNADVTRGKKRKRSKKDNKNMVNDLCIDASVLFLNKFALHSKTIVAIQNINHYAFASCDEMNQIILWKNAYYVSNIQNKAIKRYYNLY